MIEVDEEFYNQIREDSEFLGYLESLGVDNWEGYAEAVTLFKEERG